MKSYKNQKMIVGKMLITRPDKKRQMDAIIQSIASQLQYAFQTAGGETGTGLSLRSWIVSSLPLDDSLSWIPQAGFQVEFVEKDHEGVNILIEQI